MNHLPLFKYLGFLLLLSLVSCRAPHVHHSPAYLQQYQHLSLIRHPLNTLEAESPYTLTIYVRAPRLDYTSFLKLCHSTQVHPVDGNRNGDVGHAWVRLVGQRDGETLCVEGGHTGDFGHSCPKYAVGIRKLIEKGDPNPIRYIWTTKHDGIFQPGNGGHSPTFAAKFNLTQKQFEKALRVVNSYDYQTYRLLDRQCASFAVAVAQAAEIELDHTLDIEIEPVIRLYGCSVPLWSDPYYRRIKLTTPDILERSLIYKVADGQARAIPLGGGGRG